MSSPQGTARGVASFHPPRPEASPFGGPCIARRYPSPSSSEVAMRRRHRSSTSPLPLLLALCLSLPPLLSPLRSALRPGQLRPRRLPLPACRPLRRASPIALALAVAARSRAVALRTVATNPPIVAPSRWGVGIDPCPSNFNPSARPAAPRSPRERKKERKKPGGDGGRRLPPTAQDIRHAGCSAARPCAPVHPT